LAVSASAALAPGAAASNGEACGVASERPDRPLDIILPRRDMVRGSDHAW
jgi:hypothetical protein